MFDACVTRLPKQDGSGKLGGGGSGLDAKSALASAPEESGRLNVKAIDGHAIGGEAPQPRPAALNPLDWPVNDAFETVNCSRYVDLFRGSVTRIRIDFVMRAQPDRLVAFALEVEAASRIID